MPETPTDKTPLAVTHAVFERFGAGDIDGILAWFAPDAVIDFYGPATIPYAGHYEGLDGARRFFEMVLSSVDIHQFDPEEFICEGNKVVVTGHLNLTARSTGGAIDSDFVHVITVENGKWIWFRDFMNTHEAVTAFSA